MAWGPQPHQIGNLALVRSGGDTGAKLLLPRLWLANFTNGTVPKGARWVIARLVGGGGNSSFASYTGGGGGEFARSESVCAEGQAYTVTGGGAGTPFTFTLDGKLICRANAGGPGTGLGGTGGTGGVGDITAAGGNGGIQGGNGTAGINGGDGGISAVGNNGVNSSGGGGSGGERGAPDLIIRGGDGKSGIFGAAFPGGGGGYFSASASPTGSGAGGVAVLEFWSGKP